VAGHCRLRWTFGPGAALAGVCWFASLGFGGRLLARFPSRPASRRVLDALVAAMMTTTGGMLIADA
jgi:L-lysine exporter family protein LysE/ArgO